MNSCVVPAQREIEEQQNELPQETGNPGSGRHFGCDRKGDRGRRRCRLCQWQEVQHEAAPRQLQSNRIPDRPGDRISTRARQETVLHFEQSGARYADQAGARDAGYAGRSESGRGYRSGPGRGLAGPGDLRPDTAPCQHHDERAQCRNGLGAEDDGVCSHYPVAGYPVARNPSHQREVGPGDGVFRSRGHVHLPKFAMLSERHSLWREFKA